MFQAHAEPAKVSVVLRASPAFARWPASALDGLARRCRLIWLESGQQVSGKNALGACSYLVQSGWLMLRDKAEGAAAQHTLGLLGPGAMICDLLPALNELEVVVKRGVGLVEIPTGALRAALDGFPEVCGPLMLALLDQEQAFVARVVGQLTGSVSQRVAQTVLQYASLLGESADDGPGVDLNLSQDELGSLLRLSRATVGRELGALQTAGLIDRRYGRIHVRCMESLRRAVIVMDGPSAPR